MEKYYHGKYDRAFKEVMLKESNKDLLKVVLEKVLNTTIKDIEYKPTERLTGNVNVRGKRLDLLAITNVGLIDIEINGYIEKYSRVRNMSYISNEYASYTRVENMYEENINFIQINFSYGLSSKNKFIPIMKTKQEEYMIQNENNEKYVKNFKIIEVNMDYYLKIWYSKNEKEIEENSPIIMLGLEKEELEKLSKKDKVANKFMEELNKINKDYVFREYMTKEEDDEKMLNTLVSRAKKEGLEQGISQGIEQGIEQGISKGIQQGIKQGIERGLQQGIEQNKKEFINKLISKNYTIKQISELLEMKENEIEKILKQ